MLSRKRYSKRSSGSPPTRYYTVTVEAQPDDAGTVNGGGVYARGDYAVVYATVGAGYRFVSWTENGSIVSYSSMYGFDVYQDRHLVANFELAVILTLSTSPEGIGSTTGAGTYPMNTSVYIYANVPEGYNFSHWEENGEVYSYMNYILVTLLSTNRHLTAVFVDTAAEYTLTLTSDPEDAGELTGAGTYPYFSYITINAQDKPGFVFNGWYENDQLLSLNREYFILLYYNRHLVAKFDIVPVFRIDVITDPEGAAEISGIGFYSQGSIAEVSANSNEGYRFIAWEVFENEEWQPYSDSENFTVTVLSNYLFKAVFEAASLQVTLSVDPVNSGTVTGDGYYFPGDMVTVRAFPESEYNFLQWNDEYGNYVSDMRVFSFLISENTHLEAVFELKEVEPCDEFEIECNCSLSFDSYINNTISVLSVGNLVAGDCEFEEYLIDWYRDGEHALVSGVGNDPEIEAFHPFIGDAAIPVLPGTWVPRVRYVVINGERVYAYNQAEEPCQKWCTLLQDLPVIIVVEPVNCLSVNTTDTIYPYTLAYKTDMDFSLASRAVKFELPDDGSAAYLAFSFHAVYVADKIEIFLNDSSDPLTSWIVGYNLANSQYDTMPYLHKNFIIQYVLSLPQYTPGDYLIIRITPSVYENNINTEWYLHLKCLGADTEWGCDYPTPEMQEITAISIVDDPENCREIVKFTVAEKFPPLHLGLSHPMENLRDYAGLATLWSGQTMSEDEVNKQYIGQTDNRARLDSWNWQSPNHGINVQCNSVLHISKIGNLTTFQCTSIEDYNAFYDSYQALILSDYMTEFVNDNTNYKYYNKTQLWFSEVENNCGDNILRQINFHFHPTAVFSFDPVLMKIEITTMGIVFGLPYSQCDLAYDTAKSMVDYSINYYHNLPDFSFSTMCRPLDPFSFAMGVNGSISANNLLFFNMGISCQFAHPIITPCGETSLFCPGTGGLANRQIFPFIYVNVIYSGVLPRYENYEVRTQLNSNGCIDWTVNDVIYKVENGVVTVNNLPYKPIQP